MVDEPGPYDPPALPDLKDPEAMEAFFVQTMNSDGCYLLDENKNPVRQTIKSRDDWYAFIEKRFSEHHIIEKTYFNGGKIEVSTVFTGMGNTMYETMVFGGEVNGRSSNAGSLEKAKANHDAMCHLVQYMLDKRDKK